jgi:predicted nucleotide-binding protein (sugar kinase/HSP70/actin superfamily)
MIVGDDFQKLLRKVEKIKQEKSRADGALEQVLKRLKEEFGCKSLTDAKRLLEKLGQEERDLFTAYNEARRRFDKKWKAKLGELE